MDRSYHSTQTKRTFGVCGPPLGPCRVSLSKQRKPRVFLPSYLNSWTSAGTKHRRNLHSHFSGRPGGPSSAHDLRGFYSQRQFSEDSGFSSCGSSASSVADDAEPAFGLIKFQSVSSNISSCQGSSYSALCRSQSRTVASVLAAGVSDSEDTDINESDNEEHDSKCFIGDHKQNQPNLVKSSCSSITPTESELKRYFQKVIRGQKTLEARYCGRDLLDLGNNILTKFPLRATELPAVNLDAFLQNRSQYHRLGKFGTSETLHFASCMKQCGFSFPVPQLDS